MAHVLAIKSSELLAVGDGPAKLSAAQLAAAAPAEHWVGASAGHGAKGRRLYDWIRIQLTPPAAADGSAGCWSGAAAATASWPFTPASGRSTPPWSVWFGWPGSAGRSRTASSRPRTRSVWTTTRSAAGRAGTGTSPWPCSPTPSWWSPEPRPPPARAQRGTRRPDRRARPAPTHRSRGPPPAGGPGVDSTGRARLGAGLVTLAPTPSGPSATRTLPATRTASGRVGDWRGPVGHGPFPVPAHQTVRAVLPHTAYRRSSPAVFGLAAPVPEGSGRNDGSIEADQAHPVGRQEQLFEAPSPGSSPVALLGQPDREPLEGVVPDLAKDTGGVAVAEVPPSRAGTG